MNAYQARMLQQTADMFEKMNKNLDLDNANVRCMLALTEALRAQGLPASVVVTLVANAQVEISEFDMNNSDWARIINNYAELAAKAYNFFSTKFQDPSPFLAKFTFSLNF